MLSVHIYLESQKPFRIRRTLLLHHLVSRNSVAYLYLLRFHGKKYTEYKLYTSVQFNLSRTTKPKPSATRAGTLLPRLLLYVSSSCISSWCNTFSKFHGWSLRRRMNNIEYTIVQNYTSLFHSEDIKAIAQSLLWPNVTQTCAPTRHRNAISLIVLWNCIASYSHNSLNWRKQRQIHIELSGLFHSSVNLEYILSVCISLNKVHIRHSIVFIHPEQEITPFTL